jgi:inorganic pyrophosphatase
MKPTLYDIDPGASCPEVLRMIVEIPKGSANKYEYDAELAIFRLDRPLYTPVHYRAGEMIERARALWPH